jgi:hypothetical protein
VRLEGRHCGLVLMFGNHFRPRHPPREYIGRIPPPGDTHAPARRRCWDHDKGPTPRSTAPELSRDRPSDP